MSVNLFIKYNNKIMQFPVTPESITRARAGNNEEVDVVNVGGMLNVKKPLLMTYSFEGFLPRENDADYITTKGQFAPPEEYIEFIEKIRTDMQPALFVVEGLGYSGTVAISEFEYVDFTDEVTYTLELQDFRKPIIRKATLAIPTPKPDTSSNNANNGSTGNKPITIGCKVIASGRLHYNSYGAKPGKTEKDAIRYVNFYKTDGRSHPVHLSTDKAGKDWRGWVTKDSVRVID